MSVKQITTGQDSFLDIVANLVGVLIILVVVIGAQASSAWQSADATDADLMKEQAELAEKLSSAHNQMKLLESDNHALEEKILREVTVNSRLNQIRHQMLVQLQIVEQEVEAKKQQRMEQLSEQQQTNWEQLEKKKEMEIALADIKAELQALDAYQPKSETIEHFPNPIAKTVFSNEVHFQIRYGKIAFVPLNELVSRMKSEWKVKAEKLRTSDRTLETVGPVQNFRLQYELQVETTWSPGSRRPEGRQLVRFERFTIFPTTELIGDKVIPESLENSRFAGQLQRYSPEKTTVSLWVYPDSFAEYNEVKDWLYEKGYQVACWPLEFNRRISGGPNGFRTSAQ